MSKVSTKPPSGTRDFLPEDIARRRHVLECVEDVYQSYGFVPLETPAIENLTTLLGKYGAEGDQLIYRLLHRRDALARALGKENVDEADLADLGLRFDLTVPLARVVAEHGELPRFFKRYQVQPVWRGDRPARGRFREFYQCDVDVIGTSSLIAEAEILSAVASVLSRLGFRDFTVRLNHRKLLRALIRSVGISADLEQTALIALDKLEKIGPDGVRKELAARDIASATADQLLSLFQQDDGLSNAARIKALRPQVDKEGNAALDELTELQALLSTTAAADHLQICPELARGLSYYTGAIFEITVKDLAGSLGGGGRYDDLLGTFSKKSVPAVGCSLGLERVLLIMAERKMYPDLHLGPEVFLCWLDVRSTDVVAVAEQLRQQGLRIETFPEKAKLGKQLQYADKIKAPYAAILGTDELTKQQIVLKHLASGEQKHLPLADVAAYMNDAR